LWWCSWIRYVCPRGCQTCEHKAKFLLSPSFVCMRKQRLSVLGETIEFRSITLTIFIVIQIQCGYLDVKLSWLFFPSFKLVEQLSQLLHTRSIRPVPSRGISIVLSDPDTQSGINWSMIALYVRTVLSQSFIISFVSSLLNNVSTHVCSSTSFLEPPPLTDLLLRYQEASFSAGTHR
jgi:hypothetical protein